MLDNTMRDTMNEIYGTPEAKKDNLLKDIASLEKDIKKAQDLISGSSDNWTSYMSTISPEQSIQEQKQIVFLKKDLEKKRTDYDELGAEL